MFFTSSSGPPQDSSRVEPHRRKGERGGPHVIVYLLDFAPLPFPNGSTLRVPEYCRRWRRSGHKVYFLVPSASYDAGVLQNLVNHGQIDGFSRLPDYQIKGWWRLSRALLHPGLRKWMLIPQRRQVLNAILERTRSWGADAVLLQNPDYLFAIDCLKQTGLRVVIDWTDSQSLYWRRAASVSWQEHDFSKLLRDLYRFVVTLLNESHYSRKADANVLVSEIDARFLARISGVGHRVHVLPLGVNFPELPALEREPDRIIFTGWMNYRPNYEAALWFMDRVFPAILQSRPAAQFVIAGAAPVTALQERASESVRVTGAVADLALEIARSAVYVAPMVSGVGFKCKVVEAMAAGTYVVGTTYSAEFLPQKLRECMTIVDEPASLARAVLDVLSDPESYRNRVERAQAILRREYSWDVQAENFASVIEGLFEEEAQKPMRLGGRPKAAKFQERCTDEGDNLYGVGQRVRSAKPLQ